MNVDFSHPLGWVVAVLVVVVLVLARRRPPEPPQFTNRRAHPEPGEFWMAQVPFADGSGSKDRPCLVVRRAGTSYQVAYITSQDKSADSNYVRLVNQDWPGAVGRTGVSYLRVATRGNEGLLRAVPTKHFRRYLGPASAEVRRRFSV